MEGDQSQVSQKRRDLGHPLLLEHLPGPVLLVSPDLTTESFREAFLEIHLIDPS